MSSCESIKDYLGPYLDGEVAPTVRREVENHLSFCHGCESELDELRAIAAAIAEPVAVSIPPSLWHGIESRLENQATTRHAFMNILRSRSGFAVAAGIAILVGLGLFALPLGRDPGSQAQAASVDFGVLLEDLHADVHAAFEKFLSKYDAKRTIPLEAKRYASNLNFDLPATLPGGFELQATYALRFGDAPGVAARYDRGGEFLGAIFHPPVLREDYGTHRDHACVVGKHRGHKVPVGQWSLVHLTDPSTCHCVLSKLSEDEELPAVMAAIAPTSPARSVGHEHDHVHTP